MKKKRIESIKIKESYFFHSHPNDSSFSPADISLAKRLNMKSMNIVSNKYDYSLSGDWTKAELITEQYNSLKVVSMKKGQKEYDKLRSEGLNDKDAQNIAWSNASHTINNGLATKFGLKYKRIIK